jgi:hypothetical protein
LDKLKELIINAMPVDIIAKKKKDFTDRLEYITLERIVNRDGIRIYGTDPL